MVCVVAPVGVRVKSEGFEAVGITVMRIGVEVLEIKFLSPA